MAQGKKTTKSTARKTTAKKADAEPEPEHPEGTTEVTLTGHMTVDGEPRLPGDTVWVTPEEADEIRRSGYAAQDEPPAAAADTAGK